MGWLPRVLFEQRRVPLQIAVAWALALAGSLALGYLVAALMPGAGGAEFGNAGAGLIFVLVVIVSPVVETIAMGAALALLMRFVATPYAVLASAALWGILHSLAAPAWGLVIWWPFLIFSTLFATWRPAGFWRAVAIVSVVHLLQNVGPAIAIVWDR